MEDKAKKLKEKLITTALEQPEFKELLGDALRRINTACLAAGNEATVVGIFERELYALLLTIGFTFSPEKEVYIETDTGEESVRHVKKGRLDTKVGGVVIEYKHYSKLQNEELKEKATKQLKDYLRTLSKTNQTQFYGFLTDGIICREIIFEKGERKSESAFTTFSGDEALRLVRNIVLSEKTALTPQNLILDFCMPVNTSIAHRMSRELFSILKNKSTVKTQMLQQEWEQLFKLGHNDKSQQKRIKDRQKALEAVFAVKLTQSSDQYIALFALQTTYAAIIKMMAYRILSELRFEKPMKSYQSVLRANDESLRVFCQKLEDGEIFSELGIVNLLEGDFFSWYADSNQWNNEIAQYVRRILETLARYEDASQVFQIISIVDLFKGLYEHIIPQIVRSSLGEFYTPVWLAEHVFHSVRPNNKTWRGLDPCAGSGTFVLAMICEVLRETKKLPKEKQLNEVLNRVQAIDLNPLAVLTARINYFIRISHLIPERVDHLQIPVYLGDASYVPEKFETESGVECIKYSIKTLKQPIPIEIPRSLTLNIQQFSEVMTRFEKMIKAKDNESALEILLEKLPEADKKPDVIQQLKELTNNLIELERKEWNGIWARIITNFIATANLDRFDIIIGNPPWIDWKNLPSGYRERIKSLCIDKKLFSGDGRTGGINLNICALITSVSIENWLAPEGKLAFLMPQTIIFQQSYDGFRRFRSESAPRDFLAFHDWSKAGHPFHPVTEKFMTYIIGQKSLRPKDNILPVKTYFKKTGAKIAGEIHIRHEEAMKRLEEKDRWAIQLMLPDNTAYTLIVNKNDAKSFAKIAGEPYYIGREGIEFYPNELFLFKQAQKPPAKPKEGREYVENIQIKKAIYKVNKDTTELETEFLFPLVKGKEIKKFVHDYSGIVAPFPYDKSDAKRPIERKSLSKRAPKLLDYYLAHENTIRDQTEFSDKIRGVDAGEFYGLARVGPYSFADYYVGFRDNTKWCACVIAPTKTFWGEKKRMLFQNHAVSICEDRDGRFISEDEAHYLCAILNAPIVEKYIIQSSDSRSFKIRPPVKIPKYDRENKIHKKLSELSRKAHAQPDHIDGILEEIEKLYLQMLEES